MADFELRDLHLVKKALCIAALAIERTPDSPYKSVSDLADIKALLDSLIPDDVELAHYTRSAHIALTGKPD